MPDKVRSEEQHKKLSIDWSKVVTNAVSVLVAAVFLGAATVVWNAATTIDDRIDAANDSIEQQQTETSATQQTIVGELAGIRQTLNRLESQIQSVNKILASDDQLKKKFKLDKNRPLILPEFIPKEKPSEFTRKETNRLFREIRKNQSMIQAQLPPRGRART